MARHFSLIHGWGPSYPETTGYIVPTMIAHAERSGDAAVMLRAVRMLDWLVSIQLPSGAFQGGTVADLPVLPVVFNTGQVLLGLAAGAAHVGPRYREAMAKAASWLVDAQDRDGCWRKHASPFARNGEKTYDTHCAWALFEAARVAGDERYAAAAVRNVEWALGRQRANGWLEHCCLTDPAQPLTHTLGYALRGVIEAYRFTRDLRFLEAAQRMGAGLVGALRDDGFIAGRLDAGWRPAVSWACLTGTCQIAHCWLRLFEETGQPAFLDAARLANRYVRLTVDLDGPPETRGAVQGSFPISGEYAPYQYPNWAAKFFIDANVLEERICGTSR